MVISSRSTDSVVHRSEICETFSFTSYYLYFHLMFPLKKKTKKKAMLEQAWYRLNVPCQWRCQQRTCFQFHEFCLWKRWLPQCLWPIWHFWWHAYPCCLLTGVQYSSWQMENTFLIYNMMSCWLLAACAVCYSALSIYWVFYSHTSLKFLLVH